MELSRQECRRALGQAVRGLPRGERVHLALRLRSFPWDRVLPALLPDADLLDVGCGPGLLAFLLERAGFSGRYLGLDPDERKVERARRFPGETSRRRFGVGSVEKAPAGAARQAVILDVLYLVPEAERPAFVRGAARALVPGGLLVAVTSGGGPRWKRALDRLQERTAVRLLGLTRGASVAPCDGAEIAALLRAAGLSDVSVRDVGAGYSHGFELVRGVLPTGRAEPPGP